MRSAAPFVGNPDALTSSIADIEGQIYRRQRHIRKLATSCRHDIKARITSWPAVLAVGVYGFIMGRQGVQLFSNPNVVTDQPLPGKLGRALKITARVFTQLQKFPW